MEDILEVISKNAYLICTFDAEKFVDNFNDTNEDKVIAATQKAETDVQSNSYKVDISDADFSDISETELIVATQKAETDEKYQDDTDTCALFFGDLFSDKDDNVLVHATQMAEQNDVIKCENDELIEATQAAENAYFGENDRFHFKEESSYQMLGSKQ